ncbi:TetR/AcrR family transcriptional regulator [Segniliparus rugosus]|uniref:HTH tetR-type domain-containing protein n=1 Tax=Segniliparus rugosus (strain ATCC BAA-974 / DSM 45345 / CCUG 50838 / CIP 108380 / JCM 13579 / CDC 945) TaxID=679197 RepID=E5XVB6_SEGRC|nr:helix-turn-helix domain-containing protein [Segniliparus rugosus]EFV11729.1 hypothetical protein HMPREF9336_03438 [Segniliparus rugosus ATCC BAA-974]
MVSTRPKASAEPSTAERILDGALRAAEQHGLRRLTMDLIAKHAGLARVTIYGHYPNKDAIVAAVVGRELEHIMGVLATMVAPAAEHAEPAERFTEVFVCGYEWLRDNALLQRLIRTEPETILPYVAYDSPYLALGRSQVAGWLTVIFTGAEGATPPAAFQDAAELVVRVVQSLILSPASLHDLTKAEGVRDIAKRWLMPVIENAATSVAVTAKADPAQYA